MLLTLCMPICCPSQDNLWRNHVASLCPFTFPVHFVIAGLSTMTRTMSLLVFGLSYLFSLVAAHSDGMVMSMDGAMSLAGANMVPYLHFTPGDTIWFLGWVPESKGAMVGACIGLFLLALVDRWLAAIRATAERNWRNRYWSLSCVLLCTC